MCKEAAVAYFNAELQLLYGGTERHYRNLSQTAGFTAENGIDRDIQNIQLIKHR
jgi:hypothetical protein